MTTGFPEKLISMIKRSEMRLSSNHSMSTKCPKVLMFNRKITFLFAKFHLHSDLDAIVIGSGIGGLTTAAIMAKAGKKVLVLEQHDQVFLPISYQITFVVIEYSIFKAGGCCHTYIEKGYEFDVGIHYIGELESGCLNRTLVDQISDGQIEWDKLDDEFDVVVFGG